MERKENGLLSGKHGVIFGALNSESIAWKVAERCYEEGARLVLSNTPLALRMGEVQSLARACEAKVIAADATQIKDLEALVQEVCEEGKVDFILHAIGMSPNVRKRRKYDDLNYDFYHQTLDISAISLHKILHTFDKQDGWNEGASIVALSYIAAQRCFPDYADMAEAKAMLESIARSYGYHLARKKGIRVNTLSQSPTRTSAGKGIQGFDAFFEYAEKLSPLGNANAEDCANYCLFLFSHLSQRVTMQNLMNDGGFSTTGISTELMRMMEKK